MDNEELKARFLAAAKPLVGRRLDEDTEARLVSAVRDTLPRPHCPVTCDGVPLGSATLQGVVVDTTAEGRVAGDLHAELTFVLREPHELP